MKVPDLHPQLPELVVAAIITVGAALMFMGVL